VPVGSHVFRQYVTVGNLEAACFRVSVGNGDVLLAGVDAGYLAA